jgi:hypothetical protein
MTPQLIITVDTELSNFPDGQGLWGKVGNEHWGLARLIDTFEALSLRATFFLDAYGQDEQELGHQQAAAQLIAANGHDLQLHTHPAHAFDRKRPQLCDYDLDEQRDIIRLGSQRISDWTGVRPLLHRAGDWAADHRSLTALRDCGFRADFSASVWSDHCELDRSAINGNGWTRIDGMLCGVGTCYRDRITSRLRRLDLGGVSFCEVSEVLARQINPLFLTLHSFSFLQFNRARTEFRADANYVKRLKHFCQLAREKWGYRTMTALEAVQQIEHQAPAALPWQPLPTTHALASAAGLLKSLQGRLSALAS